MISSQRSVPILYRLNLAMYVFKRRLIAPKIDMTQVQPIFVRMQAKPVIVARYVAALC